MKRFVVALLVAGAWGCSSGSPGTAGDDAAATAEVAGEAAEPGSDLPAGAEGTTDPAADPAPQDADVQPADPAPADPSATDTVKEAYVPPVDNGPEVPDNPECRTDTDCVTAYGAGWLCTPGCDWRCIPAPVGQACAADADCGADAWCDECSRTCRPLIPECSECARDRSCAGAGARCVRSVMQDGVKHVLSSRVCAPGCSPAAPSCTAPGDVCAGVVYEPDNGVCLPKTLDCGKLRLPCTSDADCVAADADHCWMDLGVCGCRDTLSCASGQGCDPLLRRCTPGCQTDADCPGQVCLLALCQAPCTVDAGTGEVLGCPPVPSVAAGKAWTCTTGHCRIAGKCFGPGDCPAAGTYCDPKMWICRPGCMADVDCKNQDQVCDTGKKTCVDRTCAAAADCNCGQVCDTATSKCVRAQGAYCQTCDQQKGDAACGDASILCSGLTDDTGQDKGSFCFPPCSTDKANPCPFGWQCTEIQVNGQSKGKKCMRQCYDTSTSCPITPP